MVLYKNQTLNENQINFGSDLFSAKAQLNRDTHNKKQR